MTWDNNKNTFDSRPSVPNDEKLTASEWNNHVADQKGRVPFGPLANRPSAANADNGDMWFVTDLANDAGIMTKVVSGSWEIMGLGDASNKLPQVFADSLTADDATHNNSFTDPSGTTHNGELADSADVSSIQSSSDVDHDLTTGGTDSDAHHSKTSSASELSDVSADSVSDAHHSKTTQAIAGTALNKGGDTLNVSGVTGSEIDLSTIAGDNSTVDAVNNELDAAASGSAITAQEDGGDLTTDLSLVDFKSGLTATNPSGDEIDVDVDESEFSLSATNISDVSADSASNAHHQDPTAGSFIIDEGTNQFGLDTEQFSRDNPSEQTPIVALDPGESYEIAVFVPNSKTVKLYEANAVLVDESSAGGFTTDGNLLAEIVDQDGTVQYSSSGTNESGGGSTLYDKTNSSGNLQLWKVRINNTDGSATFDSPGAIGSFSVVVE